VGYFVKCNIAIRPGRRRDGDARATETTGPHGSQTAARTAFRETFAPPQNGSGADIGPTILGEALGGGGAIAGKVGSTLYRNTLGSLGAVKPDEAKGNKSPGGTHLGHDGHDCSVPLAGKSR
jgi:hypothetical protein